MQYFFLLASFLFTSCSIVIDLMLKFEDLRVIFFLEWVVGCLIFYCSPTILTLGLVRSISVYNNSLILHTPMNQKASLCMKGMSDEGYE